MIAAFVHVVILRAVHPGRGVCLGSDSPPDSWIVQLCNQASPSFPLRGARIPITLDHTVILRVGVGRGT